MRKISIILSFIAFIYLISACTSDITPIIESDCSVPVSYNTNMRAIVDNNCALSGCHDGSGLNGAPFDNYDTFAGLQRHINDGTFEFEVRARTMPDGFLLTEEDFILMSCWIDEGFPEE